MAMLRKACGCDSQGNRCDAEGVLWARLDAAITAAEAAGVDLFALGGFVHLPAGRELHLAREAYAAHFDGYWQRVEQKAKKATPRSTDAIRGARQWELINS